MTQSPTELLQLIESRRATLAVVGLGYVGLPVAVAFAEAGFRVIGVDSDPQRVKPLKNGESYLVDVPSSRLEALLATKRFTPTTSYRSVAKADVVLICVPTPLNEGIPNLSAVEGAGRALGRVLTRGSLVVLESTTYPGTTEDLLAPLLEADGLQRGRDFFLAFSPERIDPGNPNYRFEDIPKIVGGIDDGSAAVAEALYSQVVPKVVRVRGTREAEMAKLIENTFRHVNIALVNELALYARDLGVDIWDAIGAAATKPFGFLPFWPGPGWGGHCIPLDPAYLSWRVRQKRDHEVRFIELAHNVNSEMPRHVVERISMMLNETGKAIRGSKVLGIGVAYKGGTEDTRGSAGLKILEELALRGAEIAYHDPLVPEAEIGNSVVSSSPLEPDLLGRQDLVAIFVPQAEVEWETVERGSPLVLDCCNAIGHTSPTVFRL